jgi:predicted Kef-type K+ transport protein
MQLDLRVPLGLLFAVLGTVLAAAGFVSGERVQEINVNLWWGVVLLMFGVGSLFVAGVRRP